MNIETDLSKGVIKKSRIVANHISSNHHEIVVSKEEFFNAIENGWTIKKNGTNYIFSKKHEGRKEIFIDTYLKRFMEENFSLDQIIVK